MSIIKELKIEKQLKQIQVLKEAINSKLSIADSLIRETQFWHALCELVDIIAKVTDYVNKKKALKEDTYIDLKNEAPADEYKSDAARDRYALSQEEYRKARDDYNNAEALLSWLKAKAKTYESAMFVIKDIREEHRNTQKFTPTTEQV